MKAEQLREKFKEVFGLEADHISFLQVVLI